MGKIFYGGRGSGKTVHLLRQAQALDFDGKVPVIVCCNKPFVDTMIDKARQLDIDTTNFIFTTFDEFKGNHAEYNKDTYRIFIDEFEYFIKGLLGVKRIDNIYGTIGSENLVEVKRSEWDKDN